MDKAEHTALVRELIDAVKKEPVQPWNGKKVILSGIMAEPDEFLDIFSEFNIAVVADDLAQESRQSVQTYRPASIPSNSSLSSGRTSMAARSL